MLLATSTAAVAADDPGPRFVVSGSGTVTTPPDLATIEYRVVGKGATSDAAVSAMVAKRDDDDGPPVARLSTGPCAIIGYIASMDMSLRTAAVGDAGTIVGLLGRLGASRPHLDAFGLADPEGAQRRAVAAALVDARRQADAIAAGTGVELGRLIVASTGNDQMGSAQDVVVTGARIAPPAVSPPPIAVELVPQPILTRAQVTVTYAIAG